VRIRGNYIIVVVVLDLEEKGGLFLIASFSIHSQPVIEWPAVSPELAILIPKIDPSKHPDERFNVMLI